MIDTVPYVARILVFPIKSLDSVEVACTHLLPSGALVDDRRWAIFDDRNRYVNGKNYKAVHRIRSFFDLDARTATLRHDDGRGPSEATFALDGDPVGMAAWLSAALGFAVRLGADLDIGHPDDTHSPGPTVISVATLEEIGRWFGLPLDQVRARFRTNIEINGVAAFWEDRLFRDAGDTVPFRLGRVELLGVNPCQRCVVPTRHPATGALDGDFAFRFAELRKRTRPVWSNPARFNHFFRVAVNTRPGKLTPNGAFAVGDHVDVGGTTEAYDSPRIRVDDFWAGGMVVEATRNETSDVRTFRLRPVDGGVLPFRFKAGQFASIVVGQGKERLRRAYTLSSSPRADHYEITVKRDGAASRLLHEAFVPGMRIEVSGPYGDFGFDGGDYGDVLFIAGGVGITPLMSKLRYLADTGWAGRVDLIQVARHREDLVFAEELAALPARLPGLRVHPVLTAPDDAWGGLHGRLTASMLSTVVPDVMERHVRICGPVGMASAARDVLRMLGVPESSVESEAFGGPPVAALDVANLGEREVRFSRSKVAVIVKGTETLLDAAGIVGVVLDQGCLAGVCGRCKVRLAEGQVVTGCEVGLSDADRALGFVLACQARPSGPVVVDR